MKRLLLSLLTLSSIATAGTSPIIWGPGCAFNLYTSACIGSGSGTVASVAQTVPAFLSITGSPITTTGTLAIGFSGTALPQANGGTGFVSYTTGDTLYSSATNVLSKLPIGTAGQVLTVAAGVPGWAATVVPLGNTNALAYFNSGGVLDSNTSAKFNETLNSFAFGLSISGGLINSSGAGSIAFGRAEDAGSSITTSDSGAEASGSVSGLGAISAGYPGSKAFGEVTTAGVINAGQAGSMAHGSAQGTDSGIVTAGIGSQGFGLVSAGGVITTVAEGASAFGSSDGAGSLIKADATGAAAFGKTITGALINSNAAGALTFGSATDAGTEIKSTGLGATAHGNAADSGVISSAGDGTSAHGFSTGVGSLIEAAPQGSEAAGHALIGGIIRTNGSAGAKAFGYATGAGAIIEGSGRGAVGRGQADVGSSIIASGQGSTARGRAVGGFIISADGNGSSASGETTTGSIIANGNSSSAQGDLLDVDANLAAAFGLGHVVSSYASLTIGRYADATAFTLGSWVSTDPLLVLGNGTGVGTEANAFSILKDGTIFTNGHIVTKGASPDVSACGTGATIAGNDMVGRITAGTTVTNCPITFFQAWVNAPYCSVFNETTSTVLNDYTLSTTAVTVNTGAGVNDGDVVIYHCIGYQ